MLFVDVARSDISYRFYDLGNVVKLESEVYGVLGECIPNLDQNKGA